MSAEDMTWLPNLVGGVSIWKLARDLNEPKFFDGRLLVPETEGSDSLPTKVRWNLVGLVPLAQARAKWPDDVAQAIHDFSASLERAAKELAEPESGYHKYKQAFTVPALDAGDSYFYDPKAKKLLVLNWGASPREFGGKGEFFFGYEAWGKLFEGADEPVAAAFPVRTGPTGAATPAAKKAARTNDQKAEAAGKKEDEKNKAAAGGGGSFWRWVLILLAAIALLLLAAFLFKRCQEERLPPTADAGALTDAPSDAFADAEAGAGDGAADASDAATDASADASRDGGDAGDAGDAGDGGDGGKKRDGGRDGGGKKAGGGGSKVFPTGKPGGQPGKAGGPGGQYVVPGGSGGPGGPGGPGGNVIPRTKLPMRRHFHPEASAWRIAEGLDVVVYAEMQGKNFVVWLEPDASFDELIVEWQDQDGQWHE